MALSVLFMDGFDSYGSSATTLPVKWEHTETLGSIVVGSSYGRLSSNGVDFPRVSSCVLRKTLPATTTVIGMAAAINPTMDMSGGHGTNLFLSSDSGPTPQSFLQVNADGSLSVYRGTPAGSVTLLGTSAIGVMTAGAFQHVEMQLLISATVGTVDVWVAGINVLSLTGKNTLGPASSTSVSFAQLGAADSNGGTAYFDDVVVYDASARSAAEHLGDLRIQTLLPNATGTGTVGTWTQTGGTGGSTWTAVNETPNDGDTSYQADATVSDIITFGMGNLVTIPTAIVAVAANMVVRKDDASARQVATVLRSGSTNQVGATVNSPSSYANFQTISAIDPNTSGVWTATSINAAEAGIKVIA